MRAKTVQDYRALAAARGLVWIDDPNLPRNSITQTEWQCAFNHRWKTTYTMIRRGVGCVVCERRIRRKDADSYHTLARERGLAWLGEGERPRSVAAVSTWQCPEGHRWLATYTNISSGSGCPFCARMRKRKKESDYRALARKKGFVWVEESGLPETVTSATSWRCGSEHSLITSYANIRNGKRCPFCHPLNTKRIHHYYVVAARQGITWIDSAGPPRTSQTPTLWQCAQGHQWKASYREIRQGFKGCVCQNVRG